MSKQIVLINLTKGNLLAAFVHKIDASHARIEGESKNKIDLLLSFYLKTQQNITQKIGTEKKSLRFKINSYNYKLKQVVCWCDRRKR